ncbi:MFS transporter [Cellulomonas sp. H30R-01]|uniref:MFS transporter n=1 Tax=Cellulomonas sp. H30R-01 TaxID=2704467 RepID=UPI001EE4A778|nr:MFS transporter [Cellulomonas sp. H30R-01]
MSTPHSPAASAPVEPPAEPLGRRFTAALGATGAANLADGVLGMGVPLVALTLTRSPGQIALITAAAWLPWLLLGLVAGVLVDRQDRRVVQIVAMSVRAAVLASAVALIATDRLTMTALVVIALVYGATEVFADLAAGALVPDLVPRARLGAANGRTLAVQTVTNSFVGAPIAGAVLTLGTGWVFGVPAALAVAAAVLLWRGIPGRYRHERTEPKRAGREVVEGISFLAKHRVLGPLLLSGSLMNMASTGYFAVFVLWAVGPGSELGMRAEHYTLLAATLAVGAVGGSFVAEALTRRVGEVRLMLGCWLANSLLLIVPVLVRSVGAVAVTLFLLGFTNTIGNVISMSMRQRIVPATMLGRVGGAGRTLGYGLMPVGALLAGFVAETWGLEAVFVGGTAVAILATLGSMAVVRQRMVDEAEAAVLAAAGPRDEDDAPHDDTPSDADNTSATTRDDARTTAGDGETVAAAPTPDEPARTDGGPGTRSLVEATA